MSATTCPAYVLAIFYCFPEGEVPLEREREEREEVDVSKIKFEVVQAFEEITFAIGV